MAAIFLVMQIYGKAAMNFDQSTNAFYPPIFTFRFVLNQ